MPVSIFDGAVKAAVQGAVGKAHRSPEDWRDHWIYFLLVDRFENPAGPPKVMPYDAPCLPYQGGTFAGIKKRLGYLKDLGVGALWLSPVLKNPASFGDFYGVSANMSGTDYAESFARQIESAQTVEAELPLFAHPLDRRVHFAG